MEEKVICTKVIRGKPVYIEPNDALVSPIRGAVIMSFEDGHHMVLHSGSLQRIDKRVRIEVAFGENAFISFSIPTMVSLDGGL